MSAQGSKVSKCESCKSKNRELFIFDPTIHTFMDERQRNRYKKEFLPGKRPWLCPNCYAYYAHVEDRNSQVIPGYLRTSFSWR